MSDAGFPDRMALRGLRVLGRHGVHPREQVEAQPFELDVVLHADLSGAAERDELVATVDYAALAELVTSIVTGPSVRLIERLADRVARAALAATDPGLVDAVEVTVRKPAALGEDGPIPEVTLLRRRNGA